MISRDVSAKSPYKDHLSTDNVSLSNYNLEPVESYSPEQYPLTRKRLHSPVITHRIRSNYERKVKQSEYSGVSLDKEAILKELKNFPTKE